MKPVIIIAVLFAAWTVVAIPVAVIVGRCFAHGNPPDRESA